MLNFLISILVGTGETLSLAILALIFGLIIGVVLALGLISQKAYISHPINLLYTLVQGLPEMLLLLIAYFEIPRWISWALNRPVEFSPFAMGICTLALIFGCYAAKLFFSAFQGIHKGQQEASRVLGLKPFQSFTLILLPQIFQKSLAGLGNLWLILLKDTALVSLIGVSDLMSRTKIAIGNTHKPFTFYMIAAGIYLLITLLSEKLIKWKAGS